MLFFAVLELIKPDIDNFALLDWLKGKLFLKISNFDVKWLNVKWLRRKMAQGKKLSYYKNVAI